MGEQEIVGGGAGGRKEGWEERESREEGRGIRRGLKTGVGGRYLEEGRSKKQQGWTEWKRRGRKQDSGSRKETLRGAGL